MPKEQDIHNPDPWKLGLYCLTSIALIGVSLLALKGEIHAAQQAQATAWPDPLVLQNGVAVRDRIEFEQQRRSEILHLFEENVYGKTPSIDLPVRIVRTEVEKHALHGLAQRKQITLAVGRNGERTWHLLQYMPAHPNGPVPVIVGLNFGGNQTVDADPGIELNPIWIPDPTLKGMSLATELSGHVLRTAEETTRGVAATQWQVEEIVARGYGLATIYGGDIEPDYIGGIGYGIRPLMFTSTQSLPAANDWGPSVFGPGA